MDVPYPFPGPVKPQKREGQQTAAAGSCPLPTLWVLRTCICPDCVTCIAVEGWEGTGTAGSAGSALTLAAGFLGRKRCSRRRKGQNLAETAGCPQPALHQLATFFAGAGAD